MPACNRDSRPAPGKRPRNRQCSLCLIIYNDVGQSHNASLTLKYCLNCSKVTRPSTCDQMVSMWPVYLFAYSVVVILYTFWFSMVTVFICLNRGLRLNDLNFYVMGTKYMLSLLSAILVLCNRVERSENTSYFELF